MNVESDKKRSAAQPQVFEGTGVVALIDALGFRGMSKNHQASELLKSLRTARETIASEAEFRKLFGETELLTAAFSDTILVAGVAGAERPPGLHAMTESDVLQGIGNALATLIRSIAESSFPLIYRGCIAVGNLAVQGSYFVGQAVDEAAEWFERADASVVWLVPSARRVAGVNNYFFEWDVPFKGGGSLRTLVLNPLWDLAPEHMHEGRESPDLDELIRALLAPFATSNNVDVVRKAQNTEAFLAAAKDHTLRRYKPEFEAYVEEAGQRYAALAEESDEFDAGEHEERGPHG